MLSALAEPIQCAILISGYKRGTGFSLALIGNICYHGFTKGLPLAVLFDLACNVPSIAPNPITNWYHIHTPLGRGYGAHSTVQLRQIDYLKSHLGSKFNYREVVDGGSMLDPEKIAKYAGKRNISLFCKLTTY